MAAQGLKRDELLYELKLRHEEWVDYMTLNRLRNILSLLLLEKEVDLEFPEIELDVSSEFTICMNKFSEMQTLVSQFFDSSESMAYTIIDNRLLHLLSRTCRLVSRAPVETKEQIDDLVAQILELDEEFNTRCEDFSSTAMSPVAVSSNANVPNNTVVNDSQQIVDNYNRPHAVPVYKWGIKFTGEPTQSSVAELLERIEEMRISRGASKDDLYRSIFDLLEGSALSWYRAVRSSISSWDDFVIKLKAEFQPLDYENDLWNEIFQRVQGPDERVGTYIACMINLFARLSEPTPELKRLNIIRRNLDPYFINHLGTCVVTTIEQLSVACKQLEENRHLATQKSTRRTNSRLVEPAYAYRKTKSNSPIRRKGTLNQCNEVSTNAVTNEQKCWNCLQSGHLFAQCSAAKNRFCYRCGNRDHIANSCSVQRVVKSENFNAGN